MPKPVKKVLVRMPEALHVDIQDEALRRGISINAEIVRRLQRRHWVNRTDYALRDRRKRNVPLPSPYESLMPK